MHLGLLCEQAGTGRRGAVGILQLRVAGQEQAVGADLRLEVRALWGDRRRGARHDREQAGGGQPSRAHHVGSVAFIDIEDGAICRYLEIEFAAADIDLDIVDHSTPD